MIIKVLSRQKMESFSLDEDYAVISICEPNENLPIFLEDTHRKKVLKIEIHDVDNKELAINHNYKMIGNQEAIDILNYIESLKNKINVIVIHCFAGISRSSGVAAALYKIYTGDDSIIFENPRYVPNSLVYTTILNKAYEMGIYNLI